jgi:hypothetical protein
MIRAYTSLACVAVMRAALENKLTYRNLDLLKLAQVQSQALTRWNRNLHTMLRLQPLSVVDKIKGYIHRFYALFPCVPAERRQELEFMELLADYIVNQRHQQQRFARSVRSVDGVLSLRLSCLKHVPSSRPKSQVPQKHGHQNRIIAAVILYLCTRLLRTTNILREEDICDGVHIEARSFQSCKNDLVKLI